MALVQLVPETGLPLEELSGEVFSAWVSSNLLQLGMSLDYATEKFSNARRGLALHPGRIRERLRGAWTYHLAFIELERDIPDPDMREEFNNHKTQMTSGIPENGEGTIAASARAMSEDDALEEAEWILAFLYRLEGLKEEMESARRTN